MVRVKFRVYLLAVAIDTPVDLEIRKVMDYTNWRAGQDGGQYFQMKNMNFQRVAQKGGPAGCGKRRGRLQK